MMSDRLGMMFASTDSEDGGDGSGSGGSSPSSPLGASVRPEMYLEYCKVQDGQTLDVAVYKEPLRDCYVIHGINTQTGARKDMKRLLAAWKICQYPLFLHFVTLLRRLTSHHICVLPTFLIYCWVYSFITSDSSPSLSPFTSREQATSIDWS